MGNVREERKNYRLAIKNRMKVENDPKVEGDKFPSIELETENDLASNNDTEIDVRKEKKEELLRNKKKAKKNKRISLSQANDVVMEENVATENVLPVTKR